MSSKRLQSPKDPTTPDPREERLVSWAKETIDRLRRRVTELKAATEISNEKHAGSEVHLRRFVGGEFEKVPLPASSHVFFTIPHPDFPELTTSVEVWVEPKEARGGRSSNCLVLNSREGALNIVPCASNSVYVDVRRY